MHRPHRLLAQVIGVGVLVGAAACAVGEDGAGPQATPKTKTTPSPLVKQTPGTPTTPPTPAFTAAQARSALLRTGDLGWGWGATQGAATWRDGLLKGKADVAECQKLLDAVYAEDLLGEPTGAKAVAGFDDSEYGAQVRYQVGAYKKADVEGRLRQAGRLAEECDEFTVTGAMGRTYDAQVTPVELPDVGDARQGLRLVVSGEVEGEEGVLTLDVAAVRVGDSAALFTHGGLYGIDDETTWQAVQAGAQRLKDVVAGAAPRAGTGGDEY
ncbi:hypothetical protein [Streptomyces sp. NPDC002845]